MTDANQNPATLALNEALASAFESGDFQAVGKAFVEDAVLLPPRGRPIRGRDAIAMFWNGFSNRIAGISFATGETKAIGETMIRETGTVSLTLRNEGDQPATGKFLFLWLKDGDDWLLESAMWTRNNGEQALQGGRARQGGASGANRQGGGQRGYRQGGQGAYRQGGNQGGNRQGGGYQQKGGYGRNRGGIGGQAGGVGGGGGAGVGGMGGQQRRGGQRGQGGQQGQGGQRGQGGQGGGSQNLYDQHLGLYSNRDD